MHEKRRILAVGLSMLFVLSMTASAGHGFGRKAVETYQAPFPNGVTVCNPGGPDLNGACFDIQSGEFNTTFHVSDCCQTDVGGTWELLDNAGAVVNSGNWCNDGPWIIIPQGATELRVNLDTVVSQSVCGFPTTSSFNGSVSAWFW